MSCSFSILIPHLNVISVKCQVITLTPPSPQGEWERGTLSPQGEKERLPLSTGERAGMRGQIIWEWLLISMRSV